MTSGSRFLLAAATLLSGLLLAATARTASAHGGHGGSGAPIGLGRATAGALLGGDELGFHADGLVSGPSGFTFGVDATVLTQKRDAGDESMHNVRMYIGFALLEFPAGGFVGVQLALHLGDRLVGGDGYTEFGAGVEAYQPLFLDDAGHPYWAVMVGWQFGPFNAIDEDWQLKFVTLLNPLPEPRELGLWAGWFIGESGNTPFQAVYIGIGWTPHVHH